MGMAAATWRWTVGIGGGSGVFFDGGAEFVKLAIVLAVLGSDAFGDGLRALKLCAGIEEAALLAAVQLELHLGQVLLGSKPAVRTAPQLAQRARVTVPTMRGVRGPNDRLSARAALWRLAVRADFFFSVLFFRYRDNRDGCTYDPQTPPCTESRARFTTRRSHHRKAAPIDMDNQRHEPGAISTAPFCNQTG